MQGKEVFRHAVTRLAEALLSERGEASGAVVARELHDGLRTLGSDDRLAFHRFLATNFQPDATRLRAAAGRPCRGGRVPAHRHRAGQAPAGPPAMDATVRGRTARQRRGLAGGR